MFALCSFVISSTFSNIVFDILEKKNNVALTGIIYYFKDKVFKLFLHEEDEELKNHNYASITSVYFDLH